MPNHFPPHPPVCRSGSGSLNLQSSSGGGTAGNGGLRSRSRPPCPCGMGEAGPGRQAAQTVQPMAAASKTGQTHGQAGCQPPRQWPAATPITNPAAPITHAVCAFMTFLLFSGRPEFMARFAPCGTVATARSYARKVGHARREVPWVGTPRRRRPWVGIGNSQDGSGVPSLPNSRGRPYPNSRPCPTADRNSPIWTMKTAPGDAP
jgi:hypothetical protein